MKPLNLESFVLFIKNISIMKNLTNFRKTAETGVDPHLAINYVYKSMINKCWITLPVVYSPFASKAFFWAILKEFEFTIDCSW